MPIWRAPAITKIFKIVPNPGFSLSGIQSKRTMQLINAVAPPIGMGRCNDNPSANTVQGELPMPDWSRNASPIPKTDKPKVNTEIRSGEIDQREGAVHGVIGIVRCGLKKSLKILAIPEPYYEDIT